MRRYTPTDHSPWEHCARAVWQRRLATIGPSPNRAGDAGDVRGVVLHEQLAALPAEAAAVWAAVVALRLGLTALVMPAAIVRPIPTAPRLQPDETPRLEHAHADERMNRREAVGLVAVAWTNGRASMVEGPCPDLGLTCVTGWISV